jgi:transcription initiation factor TFIIIB Brf1 subunit/transcription initiation factor TFIIB
MERTGISPGERMANKAHKPTEKTRSEVAALCSFGIPQEDIAEYIGVSHVTLRKHYAKEIKLSSIKANRAVGEFLFRAASGRGIEDGGSYSDCVRAAMFWAKTRMGWREKDREEDHITEPIRITITRATSGDQP